MCLSETQQHLQGRKSSKMEMEQMQSLFFYRKGQAMVPIVFVISQVECPPMYILQLLMKSKLCD